MSNPSELAKKARANSVKQLCELYNVVIGVALSIGVYNAFAPLNGPSVFESYDHLFNFMTFIALIIPFYHGAVRHLYATYVEEDASKNIKSWAVFFDFLVLFGEGCAFVYLAAYIGQIEAFFWGVVVLLAIDCVWGVFASIGFAGSQSQAAELKWAGLNFVTIIVVCIVVLLVVNGIYGWCYQSAIALLLLILLRTAVDYWLSWEFYFPPLDD